MLRVMPFHRIKDPDRLHALVDAILLIEADANLTTLLETIVQRATVLVGARYGALGVLERDGVTLANFITHGLDDQQRSLIGALPHGDGVLGEVIRLGQPLRVDDLATHPRRSGFPAHHPPMHQFLGVPVVVEDGTVFGNLYLTDNLTGEPFSAEDEDLLAGFGRAAGLVIDQATLRNQLRELTIAEERERLARDLHDTVIQRLFGIGLSLQMTLPSALDETVRSRIDQALDELNETIRDIRTTIFEIDRDHGNIESLEGRVKSLTSEVASRLGVPVQVTTTTALDDLVSSSCALHTVQALREILANVVRHAHAKSVEVELSVDEGMLLLEVRDDGVGFTMSDVGGHGLGNLASRAHDLGGECYVESKVGHGTKVRWTAKRAE
jgi:signal transduction histidine kinase